MLDANIKSSRFDASIKYLMLASNRTSNVGAPSRKHVTLTAHRINVVFTLRYALVSYQKDLHRPKNSDRG